jgi:hypothetical protein
MTFLRILKILFLGGVAQILIGALLSAFSREILANIYWPWIIGGEWLFPSGPGGHAMPGGAMLGILVGFLTYSLLIGYAIDHLIKCLLPKREA